MIKFVEINSLPLILDFGEKAAELIFGEKKKKNCILDFVKLSYKFDKRLLHFIGV